MHKTKKVMFNSFAILLNESYLCFYFTLYNLKIQRVINNVSFYFLNHINLHHKSNNIFIYFLFHNKIKSTRITLFI